ncbi:lipid IV(A) 3-deoxy-D-manno-octulosonic acid transferase [Campylobacter sp. VicNov18]|uniref:lipid IV(A) 3-deoxy-D-manno-octulosonic acid transferase n=1 Tax=Campylobacter bilis TaxID=2691918 RepID=UPI00130D8508|nr:lipid IV(A) 3-deoxy-D-manno-octulosonic acid transferase [Campylobacter bilis]MPV63488.1 3-deoxy-D-manno-octulosonic acid transferase [Campylobacter hepaticus]MBM0636987.1 3-deoxy-D-manno-octulosonic acid transferase [Campylobacter bilis]MCC8277699.1 lipid IV(A) 3-deoxy-D-manno-octulosonic acid transferase [Campylobacter bilis]MCC8299308.1 lipid IV(A) 3-deoxy-D-manno-octulosonic acid transferase [Campylobacter bilis]MCC8300608.1 lipid IV(A) 3-deoxy-D-manno-octulosonic acid transferase [Camp
MIFFYYILTWAVFLSCAVFVFLFSFLKPKYKISLKSRFFLYKNHHQEKAHVHFHACSYGEVKSIKELALQFDSRITTITQTGFQCAKEFCSKVNYLAFENFLPFWFKPCKVLVIFEAEYWLMLVFMAKFYQAKVILLNARISDKSYQSYKRFSFFYKKIFSYIDEVFAQSDLDKTRLESLGAKKVRIFKNIKANVDIKNNKNYFKPKEKLIIFASTHQSEEALLLDNFKLEKDEKLIIAPRHPERFKELENLLLNRGLDFEKFSSLKDENKIFSKSILLLDALGELVNFYAISDVVVLGGSFIKGIGGHNPIEAACFNNTLITGKFIHNQKALFEEVQNVYFCEDIKKLNDQIHHLNLKAKIFKKENLKPILNTIQEGIDARKSL